MDLIKRFEGCRLRAYLCPAGVWTIGRGSTGPGIVEGLTWTQEQADERLAADVALIQKKIFDNISYALNENEISALTSFIYNLGWHAFNTSTLKKLIDANPDDPKIDLEFKKWKHANGKVLQGLVNRRKAESELYFTPVE